MINGVAVSANAIEDNVSFNTPLLAKLVKDPTTTITSTASNDSSNILPYPTCNISLSLRICLELVSLDTSEWNPLTAPQATVTNNVGKI